MSDYDTIRCINFIRAETAAGRNPVKQLDTSLRTGKHCWNSDDYMRPTMPDDALLFFDFDQDQEDDTARQQTRFAHTQTKLLMTCSRCCSKI